MSESDTRAITVHERLAQRLVFGAGSLSVLGDETIRLGEKPFVIATPRVQERVLEALDMPTTVFGEVVQHVPTELVARAKTAAEHCDVTVAVGGGSAVGLAKVLARDAGLPIVCAPTTLSGSERTPIWGETTGGHKQTGRGQHVLPRTVIYDPDLFASMPKSAAAESAINALAHSVEGTWMTNDPFTLTTCDQSIGRIIDGLAHMGDPAGIGAEYWPDLIVGASLAGSVLATAGTGVHHAAAHVLGGRFQLSHSLLHAVLLPFTTEAVLLRVPEAELLLRASLGVESDRSVAEWLGLLIQAWVGEMSLAALGLSPTVLEPVAEELAEHRLPDGRALSLEQARFLLTAAYNGTFQASQLRLT